MLCLWPARTKTPTIRANGRQIGLKTLTNGSLTAILERQFDPKAQNGGGVTISYHFGRGVRHILADGQYGRIVSSRDPREFARAIEQELGAPHGSPDLQREGARRFLPEVVVPRFLDCLGLTYRWRSLSQVRSFSRGSSHFCIRWRCQNRNDSQWSARSLGRHSNTNWSTDVMSFA